MGVNIKKKIKKMVKKIKSGGKKNRSQKIDFFLFYNPQKAF